MDQKERIILSVLKYVTFFIGIILFVINTKSMLDQFMDEDYMVKLNYQMHDKNPLPTVVICNQFPFKNASNPMLTLTDYIENTFPTDFVEVTKWTGSKDSVISLESFYTKFHGRCRVIKFIEKVGIF